MVALYALTIFIGAALLFLVQPMFARMVLPLLGGSPAVWNTALVFYQVALLGGYAYAHASTTWLGTRRQAALHLAVLLVPLAVLPIAVPAGWTPPVQSSPIPWLLALMIVAVGLPFFAVSATSPVLQKWFAGTKGRRAPDPYFLYAASNAGSLLALLSYPAWIEPSLRLAQQSKLWFCGYGALVVLVAGGAVRSWRSAASPADAPPKAVEAPPKPVVARRARWVLLAFVPSSLMLGVTTYLSSEIAAVPLMWIVPLAIYLLTFVLVFARRQLFSRPMLARALPIVMMPLVLALNMQATEPIGWLMLLHLAAFFIAAMLCHGELAADRPAPTHLTEFYLWLSVGGALGGVFNALVAPLIFHSVTEYPLALVLACLVGLPAAPGSETLRGRAADWLAAALLGALTAGLVLAVQATRFKADAAMSGLVFGGPALVCYFFSRRPLRFALGTGALLLAGTLYQGEKGRVLHAERSFFGVHRVTLDPSGQYHLLVHGTTLHGMQSLDPARRREALTYYHRTGPIGDVLAHYGRNARQRIGVVGLGAGSLASYAQPRQPWTFFELDPAVLRLARDERYFTFLRDSPADLCVVLGDARRSLAAEPEAGFDVLILDAYSSDAIPVHLVTREALALYLHKLAPGGVLAFHISNLHLDLAPVFGALAADAHLACLIRDNTDVTFRELAAGKAPSIWLVMARQADELTALAGDARWQPVRPAAQPLPVWTDDYSSLWRVFRWQ